ncbi:MAG: sugar phosphate isomerase/epimerase [Planctomycetales bacterium]|nr:sugar phosphate isomerase/epimerase [Planctomycetales bacterium]
MNPRLPTHLVPSFVPSCLGGLTSSTVNRRRVLKQIATAGIGTWLASRSMLAAAADPLPLTLGFSLYGMKTLTTGDSLRAVAEIGYDSVELCLLDGYDAAPAKLTAERRRDVRKQLGDLGLKLTAVMENVPLGDSAMQPAVRERLRVAAELGHELSPDSPPVVETVMGGGKWDDVRDLYREHLGGWARVGEATKTVIAVKPHRFGAVNLPEQALWLIEQTKSPWIKLNIDPSHFELRDPPVTDAIKQLLPHAALVAVKDVVMKDGKAAFVLPGEGGQFDYAKFLKQLVASGYRGDVNVEVSGMVSSQPTYEPVAAARKSYAHLAAAFKRAEIRR